MYAKNMSNVGQIKGLLRLRRFLKKMEKVAFVMENRESHVTGDSVEELRASKMVAADVKEGQFVVLAVKGGKMRSFVVDLEFLTNPDFLRLLVEAEEEYGYEQKGALEVPCLPEVLQKILQDQMEKRISFRQWIRFNLSNLTTLLQFSTGL